MNHSSFLKLAPVLTFRGAQPINSENSEMDKRSGDWRAQIIYSLETRESQPQPTATSSELWTDETTFNLASSKDMDPELGTVLQWHIAHCKFCSRGAKRSVPIPFGVSARFRFCTEYWDIIDEYKEYEVMYAMRGNP